MPNNSSAGSEILSRLQQAPTIHPASASLFTDWSLEPGDVVTVKSDEESYMVPIYTMLMEWTGSPKVDISSSGNQKREPLPALTRRDYATRSAINGMRQKMEDQEEINQQYQHFRTETNQQLTSVYKITGVKLDRYGRPIYQQAKDSQGNPLWETDAQGNPVYDTDLQGNIIYETDEHGNYVLDEHGNKIPRKKPVYVLDEAGNPVPVYDPDSTGSISGTITQTAQSLNILYEQTGGVTEQFDPEKQYHAGDYVLSPNGVSCRFKVDHLGPWNNEHVVSVPNLQAQITTNATEISNRVTQTSLTQTLGSYITQNAYSASIGAFLDENGKVSAAKIVTEINKQTGESKVIISADMVELDGLVTVSDLFSEGGAYVQDTIHVGGLHVYEDVSIDGNITTSTDSELTLGIIECTSLTATDSMYIGETEITESFFTDSLTNASVANNTLTITKADGTTINFNKATTLNTSGNYTVNGARVTAGWSGGTYTVVATQTNYNTTTEEDETTVVGTASTTIGISSSSWNSPTSETVTADTNHPHGVKYTIAPSINLGYQVTQETGPGSTETIMVDIPDRTGLSISAADITSVYEAGRSAGLSALTWDITSWDYDDTNDVYQCSVRTWDGTSVIDTEYVSLPTLKTVVTNLTTKQSTWWKTSGTNANKYVIPGTSISAQAYLSSDMNNEHGLLNVTGNGSDIVIDPTEAITAGQNSVNVVLDEWAMDQQDSNYGSSNRVTFKPSAGTGRTYTLSLLMNMDTRWSASHTKKVYVRPGNTDADPVMEVSVDASELVGSGDVDVVKGAWVSGAITFTPASGNGDPKSVALSVTPSIGTSAANVYANPTFRIDDGTGNSKVSTQLTGTFYLRVTNDYVYVTSNQNAPAIGTNVMAMQTNTAYSNGQQSVTVTGVTRVSNCDFDKDNETATQDVQVTLSNGRSFIIEDFDFSDVYQDGLHGGQAVSTIDVAVELSADGAVLDEVEEDGNGNPLRLTVSDIYQQGVTDATPVTTNKYVHTSTSGVLVPARIYKSNFTDQWDSGLWSGTEVVLLSSTPVTHNSVQYYKVSYDGFPGYIAASQLDVANIHTSPQGHKNTRYGWYSTAPTKTIESLRITGFWHNGSLYSDPMRTYISPTKSMSAAYRDSQPSDSYASIAVTSGESVSTFLNAISSGYYGQHANFVYSGDMPHKITFSVTYDTEEVKTITLEFNSKAVLPDVSSATNYRFRHAGGSNSYASDIVLDINSSIGTTATSEVIPASAYSGIAVTNGESVSRFLSQLKNTSYYATHSKFKYSGTLNHKLLVDVVYASGDTRTNVCVEFSSAAAMPGVAYFSIANIQHDSGLVTDHIAISIDPTNGGKTTETSRAAQNYASITVSTDMSISAYLDAFKTGYYGEHEFTDLPRDLEHKVTFATTFTDGTQKDIVLLMETYTKPAEMYVYNSNGNVVWLRTAKNSTVIHGKLCPRTPVTVSEIDKNGWATVTYGGKTGYMFYSTLLSQTDVAFVSTSPTNYPGVTGWEPVYETKRTLSIQAAHDNTVYGNAINTTFYLRSPYQSSGGSSTITISTSAIPTTAFNNYGNGYPVQSYSAYFNRITHSGNDYSSGLTQVAIVGETIHYSDGTSSTTSYVVDFRSDPA